MLNISHNQISSLSDLQRCTSLSTLICSQNKLTGYDSINALSHSKALTTVDLQDNNLDSEAVSPFSCLIDISDAMLSKHSFG